MKLPIHQVFVLKHAILMVLFAGFICDISFAAVTFYPYLSVGNTYTDNLNLTPEDEEHDFITTLSPTIDFNISDRLSTLSLSYVPSYASYLRFPENNTLRHNSALSASRQLTSKARLELRNDYLYTEDPIYDTEDFDYDVYPAVRQGREPYSINTATLNFINQFGPEDSIDLGYEYYFYHNSDSTIEDREHHRPSIKINYWLVPNRYGAESEFSYLRRYFDVSEDYNDVSGRLRLTRRFGPHFEVYAEYGHELTDYITNGEDYQIYRPVVGFVWNEYVSSSFSGSFGYFFRDSEHGEDDGGPVGTIRTNYIWEQGTSMSVSGIAGYDQASYGAENLGFNQFYNVTIILGHPLSRFLSTHISAAYQWNIYTDDDPDRDDGIFRAVAGLTYQALPWMIMEANYSFRKLESNIDLNDYVENRVEVSVTMTPRQPVMLSR